AHRRRYHGCRGSRGERHGSSLRPYGRGRELWTRAGYCVDERRPDRRAGGHGVRRCDRHGEPGWLGLPADPGAAHLHRGRDRVGTDGSYLVAGFDDPRTLYRVTTDGGSTRLIAGAAPSVGEITAVDVSADGQETYFSAGYCNYNEVVYRVLGTDAYPVRVSAPVADECFGLVQANVSLSPDGAHAAVEHYGTPYDTPDVQILALASGVAEPLGLLGSHPRWCPRGGRISCVGA